MSSDSQVAANRANAQLSTGPKTAIGLQASSQNNLRHGFSATTFTLLPTEDKAAFEQLLADFTAEWNPTTPTEMALVSNAAQFHWMSDRAARLQLESLNECFSPDALPTQTTRFDRLVRCHTQFDRAFHRALNALLKLRAARQKEQIGFELAKQGAAAEAARAQHRDRQFALAELREQRAMQAEERAVRSEQRQIEKSERDAAHVAAKIATQTAKKELFDADWEAHALMNAPIPGVGYTQVQKDAFREVLKQTNG
jgi:thiol:disulfide interchange protein